MTPAPGPGADAPDPGAVARPRPPVAGAQRSTHVVERGGYRTDMDGNDGNGQPQDPQEHDQDAEPSLNSPEEGRPDGVLPEGEGSASGGAG